MKKANSKYNKNAWLLAIPALIPVLFLSVLPILQGFWTGFTDLQAGLNFKPKFVGLANFHHLLRDTMFWQSFKIGIIWAVSVTVISLVLGFGLALILNQDLKFIGVMRVLTLVPWAMPPVIVAIMWSILLNPTVGPVDSLLKLFRLPFADKNLLGEFNTALPTVIFIGSWIAMPLITVSILAALQSIQKEIIEAAIIDGTNAWQKFRYVKLPAVRQITTSLISLNIIWNFNSFGLIYVLTAGGPGGKTFLPALFVYNESFKYGNFGYAGAMGIVLTLTVMGMLTVYLRARNKNGEES